MSSYQYIKEDERFLIWKLLHRHKDTLQDQDTALESLLKNELRVCYYCHGSGRIIYMNKTVLDIIPDPEYWDETCMHCSGDGVQCAWCRCPEGLCLCDSNDR